MQVRETLLREGSLQVLFIELGIESAGGVTSAVDDRCNAALLEHVNKLLNRFLAVADREEVPVKTGALCLFDIPERLVDDLVRERFLRKVQVLKADQRCARLR